MNITKRALLIANPGENGDENYCRGVYKDIENYKNLLTSDVGGAWLDTEIKYLNRPSEREVVTEINTLSYYDYTMIAFTGHGWYSRNRMEQILILRSNEEIELSQLKLGAKKRTIILDCCRKVHSDNPIMNRANAISASFSNGPTTDRKLCREYFLEQVSKADQGIVTLTSCSIGETSADNDQTGGRYNFRLFTCKDEWVAGQGNLHYGAFSVVNAHECAAIKTKSASGNMQNPTIEKPKTGPYFPFAVYASKNVSLFG